jgi:hypothetical protein
MPIVPDTKDWTWVLKRPCRECGFDVQAFPREQLGAKIRENAKRWPELLAHSRVRARPSEEIWSALEYGCHVRDVFRLYDSRLQMMLDQENPTFPNWDQDATAVDSGYDRQDPKVVANELCDAAVILSGRFDALTNVDWDRRGIRSDGAGFTVESFGRYLIHDPIHHVNDVERGYERLEMG